MDPINEIELEAAPYAAAPVILRTSRAGACMRAA